MPIYASKEALSFWNTNPNRSRSLAASKFCHLKTLKGGGEDSSYRTAHAKQIANSSTHAELAEHKRAFFAQLEENGAASIFAKLEARMILNAAEGVVENSGISLDRNTGFPCISGSAIKGAARRHAIWELAQEDDPAKKAELLAEMAILFGYGDQEWKAGRNTNKKDQQSLSDFWLAMMPLENSGQSFDTERDSRWSEIKVQAQEKITQLLGINEFPAQLSGCISFLPAFPLNDAKIELDIVNSHHPEYYKTDSKKELALDDENPIPVIFPTVAKNTSFRFTLLPCQAFASSERLKAAQRHLKEALQVFGLGAKTNAGYGWFSIDMSAQLRADQQRAEFIAAKEAQQRRESMSEDELIADDFKALDPAEFASVVGNLENESPEKQQVACQMLKGAEKEQWKKWKKQKKGKWVERIPKIREIASKFNIELS